MDLQQDIIVSDGCSSVKKKKVRERIKKKTPWYSALYPTYKSRSNDFKRIFKDAIPLNEQLLLDYSCALHRDILVHGRLYASQHYLCFYANIFRWETSLTVKWSDITAITKEKTAFIIPNAITIHTENEKYFFTSFAARDKTYLMLFRVWQSDLTKSQTSDELWQWVHSCYGSELGLTSDDEEEFTYTAGNTCDSAVKESTAKSLQSGEENLDVNENPNAITVEAFITEGMCTQASVSNDETITSGLSVLKKRRNSDESLSHDSFLPTDVSEMTESEPEEIGMATTTCPGDHEGRLLAYAVLPMDVDELFTLLFTDSHFCRDFHEARKNVDVNFSAWGEDPSSKQKTRTANLTVPIHQVVGPKTSHISETQILSDYSIPGEIYAIDIESSNAGIPYADSFYIKTHYCLLQSSSSVPKSSLSVYCQVKYRKPVWGLVKNFIEKNCWSGLEDNYTALVKALETKCEKISREPEHSRKKTRNRNRSRDVKTDEGESLQSLLPSTDERSSSLQPTVMPSLSKKPSNLLGWAIFGALVSLLCINVLLFYKLWTFEESYIKLSSRFTSDSCLKRSGDDWLQLMQSKTDSNSKEMENWNRLLKSTIFLLRQVENTIEKCQSSLQNVMDDLIVTLLKNSLKNQSS